MSYISKKPSLLGSCATLISLQLWHASSFIAFLQRSLHEACWAGVQRRMVDVIAYSGRAVRGLALVLGHEGSPFFLGYPSESTPSCTAEHDAIELWPVHLSKPIHSSAWKACSWKNAMVSNVQATAPYLCAAVCPLASYSHG